MNCHGQSIVSLELESRAHCRQRFRNTLHRPSAETRVAFEARCEWTCGRHAGHETRCCSTVSTLECETRLAKSPESISVDRDLASQRRYLCTKRAQHTRCR